MRCRKNIGRVLAGILAVGMMVSSMPSTVYAVESESGTAVVAEQETVMAEEIGEETEQESAGTEPAEEKETEIGEDTADTTDITPEEEDQEEQEEIETDSGQREEGDDAENAGEAETVEEAAEPETVEVNTDLSAYASGAAVTASGTCGENVTWTLDADHTLTISGTGNMTGYYPYDHQRPWYEFRDEIETVIIEEGVTSVGGSVFKGFSKLENVQIADSVTEIFRSAFEDCPGVTGIDLPNNLTKIYVGAFAGCTGLSSVVIPERVSDIYTGAFEGCTSLSSVVIPASVNSMGAGTGGVFAGCVNLRTAGPIGQGIYDISFGWTEQIPRYTFSNSMIESICLPQGLIQIGNDAFANCKELYSIDIPEGTAEIGADAFYGCVKVSEVGIPRSIATVGFMAFASCEGLTDVYYGGSEEEWEKIEYDNRSGNNSGKLTFPSNPTIHYNCVGMDRPAVKRCKVYINLPGYEIFNVSLDDKVADTPASQYDPQLAHMLIAMCNSVYKQQDITATFKSFGFEQGETNYDMGIGEGKILLGYGMTKKKMEDGRTLVLVVARGTDSTEEWVSNVDIDIDVATGQFKGFSDAANELYQRMLNYIGTKDNTEFVITGFSRGAATANILAGKLIDSGISSEHVRAYTFACPDVGVMTEGKAASYPSIFNIADATDEVSWLPGDLLFGIPNKFGKSYWYSDIWDDYKNLDEGFGAHDQSKYLAYLRSEKKESEYKKRNEAKIALQRADGKRIIDDVSQRIGIIIGNALLFGQAKCPVDVEIYTSDGSLAGRIVNNVADERMPDRVYLKVDGDRKRFFFLKDDDYTIRLTGTDEGIMEYSVQSMSMDDGSILENKTFSNVALTEDKRMTSQVSIWDKEDASIDTEGKIDIPEVQLLVLDDKGNAVKEVLPDGEGTEVPYTEPIDPDDVLPEDIPADGKIPDDLWIAGVKDSYTYTGNAIKPEIRVYDGKKRLQPGQDYTSSYKNNTKVNNAAQSSTAPTITVKGKGNYAGLETATFQITAVDLSDSVVSAEDITVAYNKKVQKKVPVVTYNGKKLAANRDFTVSYPDGGDGAYKEAGVYDILLTAKSGGNFSGTRTVKCTITENTLLSKVSVKKIPAQVYTGEAKEPELTVTFKGAPLVKDTDYTVSYTDNIEIGTAKAILTGIGKYAGTKNVSFSITGTSLKGASVSGIENKTYNGCDQKQTFTVTLKGKVLTEGTDYDVSYEKNKKVGKAGVTIKGKGAYTGTIKKTFTIGKYNVAANADGRFEVRLEQDVVPYAKGGAKPGVTVRFQTGNEKWETLAEGQDYTLSYRNHTAVNDGSNQNKQPVVTLKGKGSFSGTYGKALIYKIVAQDLGQLKLTAQDKTYQNKKNVYATKITITDLDGKVLKMGTDYNKALTYSYANETTVNTAGNGTIVRAAGASVDKNDIIPAGTILKVRAEARSGGNYTGSLTGEYRITQAAISSASVSVPKQIYTGRAITLEKNQITVRIKGKQLDESQYEIVPDSYKNNVKKGTAAVTIRGVDNYGGTKDVKFTIKAKGFLWWWR